MRRLKAVGFVKRMTSGRTKPTVLACEDINGEADDTFEFVVKLRGSIETGPIGLMCEIVASRLGLFLDLPVVEPALVEITEEFVASVPDREAKDALNRSLGLNFGSVNLSGGYHTWPVGKSVPQALRQTASEIIAFDAFILNPDRRRDNPNLFWRDEELVLFDHDLAFSFLFAIPLSATPWAESFERSLRSHVFYHPLKSRLVSLDRFQGAVEALGDEHIRGIMESVPEEWRLEGDADTKWTRVGEYLSRRRDNVGAVVEEVRRVMS